MSSPQVAGPDLHIIVAQQPKPIEQPRSQTWPITMPEIEGGKTLEGLEQAVT